MANTSKDARDNRANQLNPTHPTYYIERGLTPEKAHEQALIHRETPLDAPGERISMPPQPSFKKRK